MDTYQHSGRSGMAGVPVVALVGTLAAGVLGVAYAYVLNYLPIVQISVLATIGFGCAMGGFVGWAAKQGKIRNTAITGSLGLLIGSLALYVAWAFDPLARLGPENGFIAFAPSVIAEYIRWGLEEGFWSIGNGGDLVTGNMLAGIWIAEAAIILAGSSLIAVGFMSDHPFCEECNEWTKTEKGIRYLEIRDAKPSTLGGIKSGDLQALDELTPSDASEHPYLRIDLNACPNCDASNYVTLQVVDMGTDGNGNPAEQESAMLTNLKVSEEETLQLRMIGSMPSAVADSLTADPNSAVPV